MLSAQIVAYQTKQELQAWKKADEGQTRMGGS